MVNHSGKGPRTLTPEARAQARQAEMYHHSTLIFRASTLSVRNSTLVFRPLTKPSICAQARQAEMYHQAMAEAGGHPEACRAIASMVLFFSLFVIVKQHLVQIS